MAAGKTFESKLGKQYYPVVLEHQDVLALLNSYMVQKYNHRPSMRRAKILLQQQWADFFGMYKKLIDSHVMPDFPLLCLLQPKRMYNEAVDPGRMGRNHMWNSHQQIFR